MFEEKDVKAGVTFPRGFVAAGVKAGIKKSGNLDVAVIYTDKEAAVAGTFTQNVVAAAPVYVSKDVVKTGTAHAIVANAGCANACTGEMGMMNSKKEQEIAAAALGCSADDVIIGSTGVIGVQLPMDKVESGIKDAVSKLSPNGSEDAGNAIITTDTYSKACSTEIAIGGHNVRFGAIAKGSGMIQPNMATMLCFITTDVSIDQKLLQKALSSIVEETFNMISVDGDMSTNDMVIVMANGEAGNDKITSEDEDYKTFYDTLHEICTGMAKRIASDGEGATKFLTVNVTGTKDFADAKKTAMSIANSPLVKTAFFGEDPNWGRVICAAGYSGVSFKPEEASVAFGGINVYKGGVGVDFDAEKLREVMSQHDIVIDVNLGHDGGKATVWTCDFSYEYVKINGEYHT